MLDNVGTPDSVIRLVAGILLFFIAALLNATPVPSLLAALGGVTLTGTALTRKCPLYALVGISTCRRKRHR